MGVLATGLGVVAKEAMNRPQRPPFVEAIAVASFVVLLATACSDGGGPTHPRAAAKGRPTPGVCEVPRGGLPIVAIRPSRMPIPKEPKITAQMQIVACPAGAGDLPSPTEGEVLDVRIETRGSSSELLDKKSYLFEVTGQGVTKTSSILELPPGRTWVLRACYYDKTCMRNALANEIGRTLGRWTPSTRFVEVFVNDRYRGLYELSERIENGRVRRDELACGDSDRSVILRREGSTRAEGRDFVTAGGVAWRFHAPKAKALSAEAKARVQRRMNRLERQLLRKGAEQSSWVDFALIQELANNVDGYYRSVYVRLCESGSSPDVVAGPIWDFDLAFGNVDYQDGDRTDVWQYEAAARFKPQEHRIPKFWVQIWRSPTFRAAFAERWTAWRTSSLSEARLTSLIAGFEETLRDARRRDEELWVTTGTKIFADSFVGDTFEKDVAWLKSWLVARVKWLDGHVGPLSPRPPRGKPGFRS